MTRTVTRIVPRARVAPIPTEYQEQSAVIAWWSLWSRTRGYDERLLFAIPNGAVLAGDARRRAMQMHRLKMTGFRSGVLDLFLAIPRPAFPGMFCEMKRRKGRVAPDSDQADMIWLFRRQGYNVIVAAGADEAIRAIEAYLS